MKSAIKLCDYCEKREAEITMDILTEFRKIKTNRLFNKYSNQPTGYWCKPCYDNFGRI